MENFSVLLAICAGNSLVPGEFPAQRPVTRSFDVFFYQICVWINGRENNREAGDLRRHHAHYDVIVMRSSHCKLSHEYFYRYIGVSNACCLVHILKCILLNHRLYQYFIEVCSQRCNLIQANISIDNGWASSRRQAVTCGNDGLWWSIWQRTHALIMISTPPVMKRRHG